MSMELARLWAVPASRRLVQPALTPERAAAAEAQLGVKLPASYLALLQVQNGGYLRGAWPGCVSNLVCGIGGDEPGSITHDSSSWRDPLEAGDGWRPLQPELLIPLDGDGHWDLCLDYRACGRSGEPSVTFVDVERQREEPIAPSFQAYLGGLVDRVAAEAIRLYGPSPMDVAKQLAKKLKAKPPVEDAASNPYTLWRVRLPGEHQQLHTRANRTPAWFELAAGRYQPSAETALRLPEDPECTTLLLCTDASRDVVSAAVKALGLEARGPSAQRE